MPVSVQVKNLKVRSLDVDFNEVSWEIGPTSMVDVLDYHFQVLRSESAMGPFEELSPLMLDQYIYVDNSIPRGHIYRQLHYKVRVIERASGDSADFGPAALVPDADLVAVEVRRHISTLMREHVGRRCWVLPIRTFGPRCGCWDHRLQKRTRSGCITCFDTGFARGYMHPIEAWVSIDPVKKTQQQAATGSTQQQNTTARLPYFPPLKPDDLLIEAENIRWRVTGVTAPEHVRAEVHQEIELHRIPPGDIEYKIELVLDQALKDLFLAPARNFSNPHTLEAFENEELPRIFGLYASTYPEEDT